MGQVRAPPSRQLASTPPCRACREGLRERSVSAMFASKLCKRVGSSAMPALARRAAFSAMTRSSPALAQTRPALAVAVQHWRGMGMGAGGFLDEADVTDRVLGALKNFQKVDPSKVWTFSLVGKICHSEIIQKF